MKFPRKIEVVGYNKVTVESPGPYAVTLHIKDGGDDTELVLWASESKALRKALKAAEALLTPLDSEGNPL